MNILKNKYFILGNVLLLLAIIPITLFVVRRQTALRSQAVAATNLSFQPTSVNANVGTNFTVDIYADPGTNIVSIIEMVIKVDPDKLEIVSLEKNAAVLPVTLRGPTIDGGTATLTVSTSNNVQEAIQERTKVATLTLKPLTVTTGSSTLITFDKPASQVFSLASADGETENVLNETGQSSVTIAQAGTPNSPTPTRPPGSNPSPTTPPGGPSPTTPPGSNPSPTTPPGGPSPTGGVGGGLSPTPVPSVTGTAQAPVCSGLFIDRSAIGNAPYSLVFTATGSQPGGTISKVTFSFGDGVVQEVTQAGGVGTANINVQISHTYNNPGTYPATVTLTDSSGKVSDTTTCSQTITVSAGTSTGGSGGTGGSGTGGAGGSGTDTGDGGTGETVPPTGILETSLAIVGIVGVIIVTGVFFLL